VFEEEFHIPARTREVSERGRAVHCNMTLQYEIKVQSLDTVCKHENFLKLYFYEFISSIAKMAFSRGRMMLEMSKKLTAKPPSNLSAKQTKGN